MDITIGFGNYTINNKRTDKGKSLMLFPSEYVLLDIETTGLDSYFNEIISENVFYDIIDEYLK